MDLVFLVRPGDENEDLRYSLRSVAKYAPPFDRIWIVGYKPKWVANNVMYIQTYQPIGKTAWRNARNNLIKACNSQFISENFILMNDDFIATRPIKSWTESLLKVKNTIEEQTSIYRKEHLVSGYTNAFPKLSDLLKNEFCIDKPMNYELHIPFIINKYLFTKLINISPEFNLSFINSYIVLYRSLYGNYFNVPYNEIMDDVKLYNGDPKEITTEWISFFDNVVGNKKQYPRLNKFLEQTFPNKCIYEKKNTKIIL